MLSQGLADALILASIIADLPKRVGSPGFKTVAASAMPFTAHELRERGAATSTEGHRQNANRSEAERQGSEKCESPRLGAFLKPANLTDL